jgi:hypothetical protein
MSRHANTEWELPEKVSWECANLAVLMDIRAELRSLNRLLGCQNFLRIPYLLERTEKNTRRRKRRTKSHERKD